VRAWPLVAVVLVCGSGVAVQAAPDPGPPAAVAPEGGTGDLEHLTPAVRRAVERATAAAARDGVALRVTSGWRSERHQARLHAEAVEKYGSPEAARQWVLPPEESEHVRGAAVDIAPREAAAWLEAHGGRFGLCRRYDNEPWHFERLAAAKGSSCPPREPHP